MKIAATLTDEAVLTELGQRLARHRLDRNLTQAELAHAAGVSKRTVERIEAGASAQLTHFLRVCRALDLLERFQVLVPEPLASPIEQLKRRGSQRQRASSSVKEPAGSYTPWTWDDDEAKRSADKPR